MVLPAGNFSAAANLIGAGDGNSTNTGTGTNPEEFAQCRQVWYATVKVDALEHLLMGSFAPALSILTLLINSCAIAVLLHKSFQMSPSHVILLSIFAVDMATAGVPLPFCIYFYSLEFYRYYLPFGACYLRQLIMRLLPTISNTASIWLFTYLALQRYFIVCKRMTSNVSRLRTWAVSVAHTKTNTGIVVILVMAVAIHSIQLIDRYPLKINCSTEWQAPTHQANYYDEYGEGESGDYAPEYSAADDVAVLLPGGETVSTCWLGSRFNEALPRGVATGIYATYYIIRAIFIHLLPCCLVTFATCSLIAEIRVANKRRKSLLLKPMSNILTSAAAAVAVSMTRDAAENKAGVSTARTRELEGIVVEDSSNNSNQNYTSTTEVTETGLNESKVTTHQQKVAFSTGETTENKSCDSSTATPSHENKAFFASHKNSSTYVPNSSSFAKPIFKNNSLMASVCKPLLNINVGANHADRRSTATPSRNSTTSATANREKEYSITSMLIVIMSVFLSVQLPQAFVFIWGILSGLGLVITSEEAAYGFDMALRILNILYLLTFPVQSSLCFIMNRPFRHAFWRMIGLGPGRNTGNE